MMYDVDIIKVKLESLFNRVNRFQKFENLNPEDLKEIREFAKSTRKKSEQKSLATKYLEQQETLKFALYAANSYSINGYILNDTDNKFAYFIETIDPEMIMLKLYRESGIPAANTEENKLIRKQKLKEIKDLSRELIGFSDLRLINYEIYYTKFLKRIKEKKPENKNIDINYILSGKFEKLNFSNLDNNKIELIKELSKKQIKFNQISKTIENLNVSNLNTLEEQSLLLIFTIDEDFNILSAFLNESNWKRINQEITNTTQYVLNNNLEQTLAKNIVSLEKLIHESLFKDRILSDWTF